MLHHNGQPTTTSHLLKHDLSSISQPSSTCWPKLVHHIFNNILWGHTITSFFLVVFRLRDLLQVITTLLVHTVFSSFSRLRLLLQVITTFLGSLLVGSFLNQITAFLDNPGGIVSTLGSSAPQTATFFMTFILIQAFIKNPLQLLRLPGLIIFWLKYRFATTPRQKAAVWQDSRLKYGTNVSAPRLSSLILRCLGWSAHPRLDKQHTDTTRLLRC